MTFEPSREMAARLVDGVWNAEDPTVAASLFADPEPALEFIKGERAAFPDLHYILEDCVVSGDRLVLRWSATGTQRGTYGPIKPAGRAVRWSGIHIFEVRNGVLDRYWVESSSLDRLRQLGARLLPPDDDVH